MNATKIFGFSLLVALMVLLTVVSASAVPLTVQKVQVDGTEVAANSVTKLNVERNQEVDVQVDFLATENASNLELKAFVSGYEHNDVEPVQSATKVLDVSQGSVYSRHLKVTLPDDLETQNFKLRLFVSDRDGEALSLVYPLKIDATRHRLTVKDFRLSPAGTVKAGEAVLATVRVDNRGQKDERDVKVTVSVPELGVRASGFLDKVKFDNEEETEELYLRLPRCAKAGNYALRADVEFNNAHDKVSAVRELVVEANDACNEKPAAATAASAPANATPASDAQTSGDTQETPKLRKALEVVLLVLVALLVVVGLITGFSKLRSEDED